MVRVIKSKISPYTFACLITIIWALMRMITGKNIDSLQNGLKLVLIVILFAAAWEEKKFSHWTGMILSIAAVFCLFLNTQSCNYSRYIGCFLLFLSPAVFAFLIGNLTRRMESSFQKRMGIHAILGILIFFYFFCALLREYDSPHDLLNIPVLLEMILVTLFSAYAEAINDETKRRTVRWNAWFGILFFALVDDLLEVNGMLSYNGAQAFLLLLKVASPVLLYYGCRKVKGKIRNQWLQVLAFFSGAFVLNLILAVGYIPLGESDFSVSEEWMLYGILLTLVAWWQQSHKISFPGMTGSLLFIVAGTGITFFHNQRLREVIFNLGGPDVNIWLSERVDWLGYRRKALMYYLTGDWKAFTDGYSRSYKWYIMDHLYDSPKYSWIILSILSVLVVLTVVLLLLRSPRKPAAKLFAAGLILQTLIAIFEQSTLISLYELPFTGKYVAQFLILWWVMQPEKHYDRDAKPSKWEISLPRPLKALLIVFLFLSLFCVFRGNLPEDSKSSLRPLDQYDLTAKDKAEWDAAAEEIALMIEEEEPYYSEKQCEGLSESEQNDWYFQRESLAENLIEISTFQPTRAREIAGQQYIKSTVMYLLLGDDQGFTMDGYTRHAEIGKLEVAISRHEKTDSYDYVNYRVNEDSYNQRTYSQFSEEEKLQQKSIYDSLAETYPEFFSEQQSELVKYMFVDAVLAIQESRDQ